MEEAKYRLFKKGKNLSYGSKALEWLFFLL